jgi:hypothetical protein
MTHDAAQDLRRFLGTDRFGCVLVPSLRGLGTGAETSSPACRAAPVARFARVI